MKWQERIQKNGEKLEPINEEDWYDWMDCSEAHNIDEQVIINKRSSPVLDDFFTNFSARNIEKPENSIYWEFQPITEYIFL